MPNCKTIAVCNQKGGVGKTTTTMNLGVGLAMQGKRVLLQGKYNVVDFPPPRGKDFNDFLCLEKKIQRKKPPINRGERE